MGTISKLKIISTGPRTKAGKAICSRNATSTHAIFSSQIVLKSEDQNEYDALLNQLIDELEPIGLLEFNLVEKIAQYIWKEKRLNRVELSSIELGLTNQNLIHEVADNLNNKWLKVQDLDELDHDDGLGDYPLLLEEITKLHSTRDLSDIELDSFPALKTKLSQDAESISLTLTDYLQQLDLTKYLSTLLLQYVQLNKRRERNVVVKKVTKLVKATRTINSTNQGQKYNKYELMLSNQKIKNIRELKKLQDWRISKSAISKGGGSVMENRVYEG